MIIIYEEVRIWKKIIEISFKALLCHSAGVMEENHEELSGYPVIGLSLKLNKIRFSKCGAVCMVSQHKSP
jgi:hypothetical protein